MEARILLFATLAWIVYGNTAVAQKLYQANSDNFIIFAPDSRLARQASQLAEEYRRDLSLQWLGYEIDRWSERCPIRIQIGPHAGGETSFAFVQGVSGKSEPISWQMKIYGPVDRLLDAVLPHEITHTIFATHFGRPLPRWADEGACTTVEHESEREKNHRMLISFLTASPSRGIPFNRMFTMKQYPHDILPLYAQGYSLARFLIAQKGHQHFVKFLERGLALEQSNHDTATWDRAVREFYDYEHLSDLQIHWLAWVRQGSSDSLAATHVPSSTTASSSDLVDTGNTYALATNPREAAPADSDIDSRVASIPQELENWYARQSRAKQAVASAKNADHAPWQADPFVEFRPGSLKRSRAAEDPHNSAANGIRPADARTIWR